MSTQADVVNWSNLEAGVDPRLALAPQAFLALGGAGRAVWRAAPPRLLELARRRMAALLQNPAELDRRPPGAVEIEAETAAALAAWPTSPLFTETERVALAFTEQFVIDVAGVTDADRASLAGQLGPEEMGAFVTGLYFLDYGQRATLALERLFGPLDTEAFDRAVESSDGADLDVGAQFDRLIKVIALMDALDPVTTELVRLRGARTHNCRICQSTRSLSAIRTGADESMFDKVDFYEQSDLPDRQKAALCLVDAVITQPAGITPELVSRVKEHFSPAETIEIVADVVRNSSQKVAVALAVDAPHVTEGTELYEIAPDGDVVFYGDAVVA